MVTAITTTIDIDADPQAVWDVLTDFAAYGEWNPFMARIQSRSEAGARLVVHMTPLGGRGTTFRPTVLAATPARELRWLGTLGVRGLFDGEHSFLLTPTPGGGTRLDHAEHFSGVLVAASRGTLAKTRAGFEAFNAALKERVESARAP